MQDYKFKYKKGFFWKSIKASGHILHTEIDRMDVFRTDGSIYSIGSWSKYDFDLGVDFVLFTKKKMEDESGVDIKLK